MQRPWGRQESSMFKEPQEGPCGWSWVSKGMSVRSVSFISLLSVPEQDTQPLCAAEPQLPALGFTTRFWVFMDENLRSAILCFHFDHNLKDSHKSILWVTLIIFRTEQSCGFHNHFYLFFFCNWLCQSEDPRSGHASCRKNFAVVWIEKRGRRSEPSWTLRCGSPRPKPPGQVVSTMWMLRVGPPFFHVSSPHL